jgi:hypothetical protein
MRKLRKGNIWMLVYSAVFIFLSYGFLKSDISSGFHSFYILWMGVNYVLLNIGNFLFVFGYKNVSIHKFWKFLYPVFIINLVVSIYFDIKSELAESSDLSTGEIIMIIFFVLFIMFPTYRANYRIAFSN